MRRLFYVVFQLLTRLSIDSKIIFPSTLPNSTSAARSGCGIIPKTFLIDCKYLQYYSLHHLDWIPLSLFRIHHSSGIKSTILFEWINVSLIRIISSFSVCNWNFNTASEEINAVSAESWYSALMWIFLQMNWWFSLCNNAPTINRIHTKSENHYRSQLPSRPYLQTQSLLS